VSRIRHFILAAGLLFCIGCNQAQESPPYIPPKNVILDEFSLASAIENNDLEQARSCITRGIDPNTPIEEG
jgi:hypothetical protein